MTPGAGAHDRRTRPRVAAAAQDERVPLPELPDPRANPVAIRRDLPRDGRPRHEEHALPAVFPFLLAQVSHLPREEGVLAPDRAEEHRRRVRARGHRVEDGVPPRRVDILRFVRDEDQAGGLAARVRQRGGGEKRHGRLADTHRGVAGARGPGERLLIRQQALEQPIAGEHRLRPQGRRDHDERTVLVHGAREDEHQQLRQHLVLPGLAGEDDRELVTPAVEDAARDRARRLQLVRAHGVVRHERMREGADIAQNRRRERDLLAHQLTQRASISTRMLPMTR